MGLTPLEKQKLQRVRFQNRNSVVGLPRVLEWRTFVHIDGGHDKFWKIAIDDWTNTVYTNFGANDTKGQFTIKEFDWYYQASRYRIGKIREKLGKGYRELK